jgi:pimeloyl-ACP methyl ester carboxylesterase
MEPETRYARNGDVHLAFQVVGEGELDLVFVPSWIHQSEHMWVHPRVAPFFERLASFSRLIMFDRRGTGMSDPIVGPVPIEEQMNDIVAVMDAAGSDQAAVMAWLEGSAMAALFAATHPERTRALALYAPMPRMSPAPGYEWPIPPEEREKAIDALVATWGDGSRLLGLAPPMWEDPDLRRWYSRLERLSTPPGVIPILQRIIADTDVRDVLPSVQAPTLVLHRTHDQFVDVRHARYVAAHVPGAKLVELPGRDTLMPVVGGVDFLDEVEEFLTGTRRAPETDRILATVLFTDLVGSTRRAAELGDRAWRELLARHDEVVGAEVERHRGRAVKSLGDGWLATFDGPARGIRCALALRRALAGLGLELRAGLHTGEVEVLEDDVGGLAVHIGGARDIAGRARRGARVPDRQGPRGRLGARVRRPRRARAARRAGRVAALRRRRVILDTAWIPSRS